MARRCKCGRWMSQNNSALGIKCIDCKKIQEDKELYEVAKILLSLKYGGEKHKRKSKRVVFNLGG